ncbi:hypothetical protein HY638_02465 [Candidatus Woesearchaeota archaeon]|nr:hypothetical protein [Candidatus Woesearchaeota archaeon]
MEQFKRHVAHKVSVNQVASAKYVKEEDQWAPSYLLISNSKVSRANIMGIVVAVEGNSIIIDDGTGRITVRNFDSSFVFGCEVGDSVAVIGRPRDFNGERYIAPEIVSKVDRKWLEVRKLEIPPAMEETEEIVSEVIEDDPAAKICQLIRSLDRGDGVEVERVLSESNIESCEKIISNLLKEGELFEIKPGRVKVLE